MNQNGWGKKLTNWRWCLENYFAVSFLIWKKKIQVGLVKKTAGWNYAHIKLIRQFIETANNQANLNDMNASFNGFQRDRQLPQ